MADIPAEVEDNSPLQSHLTFIFDRSGVMKKNLLHNPSIP